MGSCNKTDLSPGGLVWVRRRNGSWWPGRIIVRDDLRSSRRKRTPIQLLGRKDGSLEWHNLERPTHVKPFRCGDYDEWIERAETSGNFFNKNPANPVKYARREDAILHALDLEKVRIYDGNEKFNSGIKNSMIRTDNNFSIQRQFSFGDRQKAQDTPKNSKDDTRVVKRMRDLQDIGSSIVSKTTPSTNVHSRRLREPPLADMIPTSSTKVSSSTLKKKKSQILYDNFDRKTGHCPLSKVSVGTENKHRASKKTGFLLVADNSPSRSGTTTEDTRLRERKNACNAEVIDIHLDYEMKENETPSVLDSRSDGFVNVPVVNTKNMDEGLSHPYEFYTSKKLQAHEGEKRIFPLYIPSQLNEELSESCSTSPITRATKQRICNGTSAQYSKVKSNLSCLNLRKNSDSPLDDEIDGIDRNRDQLVKHRSVFELSSLYDVNLNVEARHHGPRVPLISLTSGFDGRAIVGYPITVRASKLQLNGTGIKAGSPSSKRVSYYQKKPGFSPRKIRKLSSIAVEGERTPVMERLGGPSISCVPLRLVFSRLHEALRD